jgi:hypothetical protein
MPTPAPLRAACALTLLAAPRAWAQSCEGWGAPEATLLPADVKTDESSGLAASRTRPGVFFTHDDSGGEARVEAFTPTIEEDTNSIEDVTFIDWEDMAAAPCPDDPALHCLYIGDIGDNLRLRPFITVHVIREPARNADAAHVATWHLRYPEGPQDSESLLVHPKTGQLTLITKSEDGVCGVYDAPMGELRDLSGVELTTDDIPLLERQGTLVIDGDSNSDRMTTGAAYTADGTALVVRTYGQVLVWRTPTCEPGAWFSGAPLQLIAPPDGQGEAVTFDLEGKLWTTSEGEPMPLTALPCAGPIAADTTACDWRWTADQAADGGGGDGGGGEGEDDADDGEDTDKGGGGCATSGPRRLGLGALIGAVALLAGARLRRR